MSIRQGPTLFQERKPSALTRYILVYYNAANFFLLSPFSLKVDPISGHVLLRQNHWTLKIAVLLMQCLSTVPILCEALINLWSFSRNNEGPCADPLHSTTTDNSSTCFRNKLENFLLVPWILAVLMFFKHVWCKSDRVLHAVNQIDETCETLGKLGVSLPESNALRPHSIATVAFVVIWALVDGCFSDLHLHQLGLTGAYAERIVWIENLYQFSNSSTREEADIAVAIDSVPVGHQVLGLILMMSYVTCEFATRFTDFISVVYSCVMYMVVKRFVTFMRSHRIEAWRHEMVFKGLEDLRDLTNAFNDSIGVNVFFVCFGTLPFYAVRFTSIFQLDLLHLTQFVLYILILAVVFFTGSEAYCMCGRVSLWLQKTLRKTKMHHVPGELAYGSRVNAVLSTLESQGVGMRGKYFTITYEFVGHMGSLILTYAVVIFQFVYST